MNTKYYNRISALFRASWVWDIILFVFILLWLYPQMTRGIFISDTAYHMYEADQAFHLFGRPFTMFWLTSYLGGLWMSLNPTEMAYWWSAFGGCIVCAFTYVVAAHIIRHIFPGRLPAIYGCLFVASVFQLHFLYDFAIHYYTLPFLCAETALLLYLKSQISPNHRKAMVFLVFSALLASILPALRLPLFILMPIPVLIELGKPLLGKKTAWGNIKVYSTTAVAGMAATYMAYSVWRSQFPELTECEPPAFGHLQGLPLALIYIKFYLMTLRIALVALACIIVICKSTTIIRRIILVLISVLTLAVCIVTGASAYSGQIPASNIPFHLLINIQESMVSFLLLLTTVWHIRERKTTSKAETKAHLELTLQITCIAIFVILYPLGSDCTIKILYGFPLIAPLCMLILKEYMRWGRKSFALFLSFPVAISLAILPLNVDTHAVPVNRLRCNCAYTLPVLGGIREEPERVATQEKLIKAIQQYSKPDEEILFLSNIYELLVFSGRKSWMHPMYSVLKFENSSYNDYRKLKPLPAVAVLDSSECEEVRESWKKNLLIPYYEKVCSENGAATLCTWPKGSDAEFSIWVLKDKGTERRKP